MDTPSRRITVAIGISILLHALLLWGPSIRLPQFRPSLPALTAKLEELPADPPRQKRPRKPAPVPPKPQPEPAPHDVPAAPAEPIAAADSVAAASTPAEPEPAPTTDKASERPPLPKHARLTFDIHKGSSNFRIGETVHTLDIDNGRYVLKSATSTVGLVRLFKTYELNQYSNGTYDKDGLRPELFTEERIDRVATLREAVELDHAEQRARFSDGRDIPLPPDTQDILSIMYQFPPLAHSEIAPVIVCNGRKIEHYSFEISANEEIDTPLGKMRTVKLSKLHPRNEEGLEIWLAREYRLFPVKLRFIEKNGEIAAEAVITDMRVSEEQGERKDVDH